MREKKFIGKKIRKRLLVGAQMLDAIFTSHLTIKHMKLVSKCRVIRFKMPFKFPMARGLQIVYFDAIDNLHSYSRDTNWYWF